MQIGMKETLGSIYKPVECALPVDYTVGQFVKLCENMTEEERAGLLLALGVTGQRPA